MFHVNMCGWVCWLTASNLLLVRMDASSCRRAHNEQCQRLLCVWSVHPRSISLWPYRFMRTPFCVTGGVKIQWVFFEDMCLHIMLTWWICFLTYVFMKNTSAHLLYSLICDTEHRRIVFNVNLMSVYFVFFFFKKNLCLLLIWMDLSGMFTSRLACNGFTI